MDAFTDSGSIPTGSVACGAWQGRLRNGPLGGWPNIVAESKYNDDVIVSASPRGLQRALEHALGRRGGEAMAERVAARGRKPEG